MVEDIVLGNAGEAFIGHFFGNTRPQQTAPMPDSGVHIFSDGVMVRGHKIPDPGGSHHMLVHVDLRVPLGAD